MNEKQAKIVESRGLGQAVVAGAGCGKTTTLVAKCRALVERDPKARFCAVSFTEKSVRDLREALVKGLPGRDLGEHWVKTIHGLCSSILREFPASAGLQGGERILLEDEAARMWERSLSVLWTSNDNAGISESLDRLLQTYSRSTLESLLLKLRSLESFGVERFITRSFDRREVLDLWEVFSSVNLRFRQSKAREGALDFNDLETRAAVALRDPAVRRHYQSRFDLVLVDEFQDTNPVQGEILEAFVRPDFSNLTIVGDPKQSIYRFRDADVSVFQDLVRRLPETHLLDSNYRSRPPIIDFVNEVCAPVFGASGLDYEPLVPARDDLPLGFPRVTRLEWETEEDLARFFDAERAAGADLSETVVLVRSMRKEKVRSFLAALEAKNIPFLLGSGGRFFEDPRVQEGIALLRGWLSPLNRIAQAAFLRSPWVGVEDRDLKAWAEIPGRSLFEPFFESSAHPIARALKDLYLKDGRIARLRPGQILATILELETLDPEMVQPLTSLWHKCEELGRQGRRFSEIVQFLSRAVEEGKIEREVPAPAERGMLRIMTVHGSKGLQFPRVLLFDFDGEYRGGGSPDLIWDRNRGVHLFERDEEGERLKEGSANEVWLELEKAAAVAESKRVFYVALTRPQEELILAWKKLTKPAKASDSEPGAVLRKDNWREWVESVKLPELRTVPETGSDGPSSGAPGSAPETIRLSGFEPRRFRPRHSPSEWLILSQCGLRYRYRFGLDSPSEESESGFQSAWERILEDGAGASTTGGGVAEQGKRLHEALELSDWAALSREFKDHQTGLRVADSIREGLRHPEQGYRVYPELGFEIPLSPDEALVGMMDRLEVDPLERSVRVVDYKFTASPKAPEEMLERYGLQLELYAFAALQLVPFKPERLEAVLAHFTQSEGLRWIELPSERLERSALEARVEAYFRLSRNESGQNPVPTQGSHCRYCEFRERCPRPGPRF